MDEYRETGSEHAFSLLFQLNRERFRRVIQAMVRRKDGPFEIDDVLHEVFMAIWRYPHRFSTEKANAFRNWSYGIIKNTGRNLIRVRRPDPVDADIFTEILSDGGVGDPSRVITGRETMARTRKAYLTMLGIYLDFYWTALNDRERRALWLVEVDGLSYKEAAVKIDVTLGNLKMIICRARKRIRAAFDRLSVQLQEPTALEEAA